MGVAQKNMTDLLGSDPDAQPRGELVGLVLLRHAAAVGQEANWVERPLACATCYETGRTLKTQTGSLHKKTPKALLPAGK